MIRLAVIALSKTSNVGQDHLIHRKRSPFPYEGKALTLLKVDETANVGRGTAQIAASEALPRRPTFTVTPTLSGVKAFPS